MDMDDSTAIYIASKHYEFGTYGLPQDTQKAFDMCLCAAKLGYSEACGRAAIYYDDGGVVPRNIVKASEYRNMAAKKGCIASRHNLGIVEWSNDNHYTAGRHWLISAAAGDVKSLKQIANFFKIKLVTKKEYSTALTSYSNVHKDERSIEREAAAAAAADELRQRNSSSNYLLLYSNLNKEQIHAHSLSPMSHIHEYSIRFRHPTTDK